MAADVWSATMTGSVGFIGLGRMGLPMAARLVNTGHDISVFARRAEVGERFASEHNVDVAQSAAKLGAKCETVILMLPDGKSVREVVIDGRDPLVGSGSQTSMIVDMSSSEPDSTCELGAMLYEHGVALVDAPVSGGVGRAISGDLTILAGGDKRDVQRVRPLLEVLGETIFSTGDLGSGHALKAINNLLSAAGLVIATEGLLIGKRFGLDPTLMLDVINASSGRNNSTESKFGQFVTSGSYDSGFALDLMAKDVGIAIEIAERTDTQVQLSRSVFELINLAQAGLPAGADHTEVARWQQQEVGTSIEQG